MVPKYVIHTETIRCQCFSDRDLAKNVAFAIEQGMKIVAVEAVLGQKEEGRAA